MTAPTYATTNKESTENHDRPANTDFLDEVVASIQGPGADPNGDWISAVDGTPLLAVTSHKLEPGYGLDRKTGTAPRWRWPCPSTLDVGGARATYRVLPLDAALAEVWTSDAHCVPYVVVGSDGRALAYQPRINKDGLAALRAAGFDVRITHAIGDVDNVPHVAWTEEMRTSSHPKLANLGGAAIWYETRKGLRILRPYTRWITPEEHEAGVHAAFLDELRQLWLAPDPACKDWTRHYRLPHVRRDGRDERPVRSALAGWSPFVPPRVEPMPVPNVVRLRPAIRRPGDASTIIERARTYIASIEVPACGHGRCDAALWKVALTAARGFDLDEAVAFDLVREWASASMHSGWTEATLKRKVSDAARSKLDAGYLLRDRERIHVRRTARSESPEMIAEDTAAEIDAILAARSSVASDGPTTSARLASASLGPSPDSTRNRPRTDLGNAERLIDRHGDELRYVPKWGKWLHWDGRRWVEDATCEVHRRAQETVRAIYEEATRESDPDLRKALALHAMRSEASSRIAAMIREAEARPGVAVDPGAFDEDPWLLNVENGVIDLRTGKLLAHDRARMVTKLAPATYEPDVTCPRWQRFLEEAQPDAEVRAYLQRHVGYGLTGVIREHAFPVHYGKGRNGKGTFVNTIQGMLGDYACDLPAESLMARRGEAHPTDRTILFGMRFASASETKENCSLDIPLVKRLTGGDPITARRMHEDFWTFFPTHKLVLLTNHKPVIRETKDAIWQRVHLVPWNVQFTGERQDTSLPEKLKAEAAGILAWAVRGCLEWQRIGLAPPEAVLAATATYREDEDLLGAFLIDRCVLGEVCNVGATDLFTAYKEWAEENNEPVLTQKKFGTALKERSEGFTQERDSKTGRAVWRGIRLGSGPSPQSGAALGVSSEDESPMRDV